MCEEALNVRFSRSIPRLRKKELVFLQSISQYTFVVSALLYQGYGDFLIMAFPRPSFVFN